MENFTPYTALSGGVLIGLGATVMLLFNGRITGVSDILGGLVTPTSGEWFWRLAFLLGLMIGTFSFINFFPNEFELRENFPISLLIMGGFLVGFGTRLGNGCTSGHGICGIGRLSLRSIIATMVFMASGAFTVFIVRHIIGISI